MDWIAHAVDIPYGCALSRLRFAFFSGAYNRDVAIRKDKRLQFTVQTSENNVVHDVGRIEIPNTSPQDVACKSKHRAGNILGRVSAAAVDCKPLDSRDRTNEKIK